MPKVRALNLASAVTDKVTQVMDFLKENYLIEVNKYDHTQMRIRSLKRIYSSPPSVDDIYLHMMQEGIPPTDTIIRKILRSPNYTKTYDPIRQYFDSLQDIHPEESQIDKLIAHLQVREFGDHPAGYYTARAARLIRLWLVGTVACALGKHVNEAALVLVGEDGGAGKTYLSTFLCPAPLKGMMVKSSSDRRVFNMEQAATSNFIMLFDEMCGLNSSTSEDFKKTLSAPALDVKLRGDLCPVSRPRIASAIMTTNNRTGFRKGFLLQSMGLRRFMCVHIDGIDHDYSNVVDIDELWAEALHLSQDPDYCLQLTQEDYREFEEFNQRYILETPAGTLIQQILRIPENDNDDSVEWLTASEIFIELRDKRLINSSIVKHVSPQYVGEAMRALGFTRKSINDSGDRRYKYGVQRI